MEITIPSNEKSRYSMLTEQNNSLEEATRFAAKEWIDFPGLREPQDLTDFNWDLQDKNKHKANDENSSGLAPWINLLIIDYFYPALNATSFQTTNFSVQSPLGKPGADASPAASKNISLAPISTQSAVPILRQPIAIESGATTLVSLPSRSIQPDRMDLLLLSSLPTMPNMTVQSSTTPELKTDLLKPANLPNPVTDLMPPSSRPNSPIPMSEDLQMAYFHIGLNDLVSATQLENTTNSTGLSTPLNDTRVAANQPTTASEPAPLARNKLEEAMSPTTSLIVPWPANGQNANSGNAESVINQYSSDEFMEFAPTSSVLSRAVLTSPLNFNELDSPAQPQLTLRSIPSGQVDSLGSSSLVTDEVKPVETTTTQYHFNSWEEEDHSIEIEGSADTGYQLTPSDEQVKHIVDQHSDNKPSSASWKIDAAGNATDERPHQQHRQHQQHHDENH